MPSRAKKSTGNGSLLDNFLGEYVVMFLTDMNTMIQSDEGEAEVPLVVEGLLVDYDSDYVMLTNDAQSAYTLISRSNIGKIDTVDPEQLAAASPKTNPRDMN